MDVEGLERVNSWVTEIRKQLDELFWQSHLELLPNEFLRDQRSVVLVYLSYLLEDLNDISWLGFTPREIANLLRDISDAIEKATQPE